MFVRSGRSGTGSTNVVLESELHGDGNATRFRLRENVAIEVAGGSIPSVGVTFDAFSKANVRNPRSRGATCSRESSASIVGAERSSSS